MRVDRRGTKWNALSVLSALARLDIDPWREAAELAQMPREIANQRLTSLLARLPDGPWTRLEPWAIAARLTALLPRGADSSAVSSETLPGAGAVLNSRAFIDVVLVNLLLMAGMTGAQWAIASLHLSTTVDSAHTSTASAVIRQGSPPDSDE
jgi:hypothetical protein